jgi:hypothetical protein
MTPRHWLAVFVAGAMGGLALDHLHVRTGTLWYRDPMWFDQAWWVAPQFGLAMVFIVAALWLVARRWPARRRPSRTRLLADAIALALIYGVSGFLDDVAPFAFLGLAGGTWLASLVQRSDWKATMLLSAALAAGGTAYEMTLSSTGAFTYANDHFNGVPFWLPAIYLVGGLLAADIRGVFSHAGRP